MEKEGSGLLKEVAIGDWHLTPTLSAVVAWDRQVRDVYVGMRKINKRKGGKKGRKRKKRRKMKKRKEKEWLQER